MINSEVRVPLLNANEPEARLVGIHVTDKQAVEKGTRLFTIETTKAASEVEALEAGFIRILAAEGVTLAVGDLLAVITGTADEVLEVDRSKDEHGLAAKTTPFGYEGSLPKRGLRITKPAQVLADLLGLDLSKLPTDQLVTEDVVRQHAGSKLEIALPITDKPFIMIYGAGGHAKSIMEIVQQNGDQTIAAIVDDDGRLTGKNVLGIPVVGTRVVLPGLIAQGIKLAANGVGGILDINVRSQDI